MLDTFYDRRNAVEFTINAIGGRMDGQITQRAAVQHRLESRLGRPGRAVRRRLDGRSGHAVQVAALPAGARADLGVQLERTNRGRTSSRFSCACRALDGQHAFMQMSLAATVVGLEAPSGSKNLEIKPYATSDLTSDLNASPRISNDLSGDIGVDVKYGVTQNLTGDFTYNTDFAQVEADEQQVNLTRFSLFFPEKREFFLENQGTFAFGGAVTSGERRPAPATRRFCSIAGGLVSISRRQPPPRCRSRRAGA